MLGEKPSPPYNFRVSAAQQPAPSAAPSAFLSAFEAVSDAVESGSGLPAVARAAGSALDASIVVLDAASSVLAVACRSPEDERAVIAGESGTEAIDLRVADEAVGSMRMRARGAPPESALVRMVATLIAQEVDRARAPSRENEAAVGDFLAALLSRKVTDRENIVARAEELGCDLSAGGEVIVARARPQHAEEGDWRARVLGVAARGARAVERTSPGRGRAAGPAAAAARTGRVARLGRRAPTASS